MRQVAVLQLSPSSVRLACLLLGWSPAEPGLRWSLWFTLPPACLPAACLHPQFFLPSFPFSRELGSPECESVVLWRNDLIPVVIPGLCEQQVNYRHFVVLLHSILPVAQLLTHAPSPGA